MERLRTTAALALFAVAGALVAGCADDMPTYRVSGAFTADPRPDWDEWEALVARYADEPAVLRESFPEQFSVGGLSRQDCEAFRGDAAALPYVASVGPCRTGKTAGGEPTVG